MKPKKHYASLDLPRVTNRCRRPPHRMIKDLPPSHWPSPLRRLALFFPASLRVSLQRPPRPVDGMPRNKTAKKVAAAPDLEPLEDRISALPDGILQHVLGFLPADEAVKTCVLARHWRHQWRYVRRLRIIHYVKGSRSADDFVLFLNRLLLLREPGMVLDEFEVSSDYVDSEIRAEIHAWIRQALLRKVRVLIIRLWITLHPPLISQHLTRLEISTVDFRADCLDSVTCPALEVLDIRHAHLSCSRILSQFIKHLQIVFCNFPTDVRACISMPSLISLQLKHFGGQAPQLEFMPSLQTAFVKPTYSVDACMKKGDSGDDFCGICSYCCGVDSYTSRCVLLGGLSNAMHLELIAYPGSGTFIFRRDLRWCPAFSKLKILLLNEWCVAIDLSALVCILEHSPVLEKLILQISQDAECKTEAEGRNHHQMERVPKVSERLKLVEIKCKNVGFRVCEVTSFLSTFMEVNLMLVTGDLRLFSSEN